jgi:proteasome lid subunit RPN8/RPN11
MNLNTERDIRAHAVRDYPRESCGVIINAGKREKYIPCANTAKRAPGNKRPAGEDNFRLSEQDYTAAADLGEIIAVVHSHPDTPARPTEADKEYCERSKVPWSIVHVSKTDAGEVMAGEIYTFEPTGYVTPILGVPFSHGVHDCYSLGQRWYKQERGIILPDFERDDGWWNDGIQNLYLENYQKAGFAVVPDGIADLRVGDAILMQIRSKEHPNHCAIYIDEGRQLMVHHMYGQLSARAVYGGYWQETTRMILRYVGK